MKINTRYVYTIFASVIGIWAIKQGYYYIREKKELDFSLRDYTIIGGCSGMYMMSVIYGMRYRYILFGLGLGLFYGVFYNLFTKYMVNKRRSNAEKIGIVL